MVIFRLWKSGRESYTIICTECKYKTDNPFFCEACVEASNCDGFLLLPITNSPRMGECGYDGERDVFEFDPQKCTKENND
jgi:hypothetical protein